MSETSAAHQEENPQLEATEQIRLFQEFLDLHYKGALLEASRKNEPFLVVDYGILASFHPELADLLLDQPEEVLRAAEIAAEQFDLPGIKKITIRMKNLPESQLLLIRNIRSKDLGKLYGFDGVVRQKSDVRPQVTQAKFECPACGNIISVLQLDNKFKEPSRCGCGRKGKFRMLSKELVDAQGLVLEEASENLEGGEQPKRINVYLKNDLVSPISEKRTNPGQHIKMTGFVKEIPIITRQGNQSTKFDLLIEANYVESIEEDYSDIKISPEELQEIKDLSKDSKLLTRLIKSIAPSIYGHEKIKEALVLQMLGGVKKSRNDGTVTRGDFHVLLIGDPGAGKCLYGNTKVMLHNGEIKKIKDISDNEESFEEHAKINMLLPSLQLKGNFDSQKAIRVWKRPEKKLISIKTRTGKRLIVTKNHPLFNLQNGFVIAKEARDYQVGNRIATPRVIGINGKLQGLEPCPNPKPSNNSKTYTYPTVLDSSLARLIGYLCGDDYFATSPTSEWISLTNSDSDVLNDFNRIMSLLFDAKTTIRNKKTSSETYVTSRAIYEFLETNFSSLKGGSSKKNIPNKILKSPNKILAEFIKGLFECDAHVNMNKKNIEYSTISKELAETLQLALLRFGIVALLKIKKKQATNTTKKRTVLSYELTIAGEFMEKYNLIGFTSRRKKNELNQILNSKHNTNIDLIPNISSLLKSIRVKLGLRQKDMGLTRSTYAHYEQNNRLPSRTSLQKIVKKLERHDDLLIENLKQIANSELFWDEILEIEEIENDQEYVYDFEVENTHNYVANGVMVHNSQLLKRASVVAPKSRYVSGKGASGAGLTASVVKDEFLSGWSLEAGALVLANKGICMIDELDKMSAEDRSAMHEALEQQTVTISKANIQATLRSETTVLAAANPKFGRFDPYETLAKQIDLPATLINRFDLIFPIRDMPDETQDTQMADFLLNLHKNPTANVPDIPTALLRKYIAYAKQHMKPILTDSAIEELKNYYIKMRNSGGDEGSMKAIPISARQLEGLIRLSEASAKMRLSQKVQKRDAKKGIELLHFCLSQVGMDPETGQIDIDRISTGVTSSERSKIVVIREIIRELEGKIGKTIPIEEIVSEALSKGLDESVVDEAVEKLKRSGDIFEPKSGSIQRID